MVTNEQLVKLRSQLIEERKSIEYRSRENKNHGLNISMEDSVGDLSSYDNHPADAGTEMFEREKDVALNDLDKRHLDEINHALQRMDEGTYGYCKGCHEQIPLQRLQAIPYVQYCIEHAE